MSTVSFPRGAVQVFLYLLSILPLSWVYPGLSWVYPALKVYPGSILWSSLGDILKKSLASLETRGVYPEIWCVYPKN